jgi:hypothetical protein
MYKKTLLFFVLLIPLLSFAQQTVSGKIFDFDNKTFPLQDVNVKNLTNNQSTKSKASGEFNLPAKSGDLLAFSFTGYHTDTLFLVNLSAKNVYMLVNTTELKEVKVVGAKINPLVLGPDAEAQSFKRIGTDGLRGKRNNDRAGGLNFNLGYGKYRRQEEKIRILEERDKYETEIAQVFTEAYVSDLVKLEGQDLKDFMSLYRPTAVLVKSERPFNYDYYTVQTYHKWLKLPEWQRKLPPIPKLKAN